MVINIVIRTFIGRVYIQYLSDKNPDFPSGFSNVVGMGLRVSLELHVNSIYVFQHDGTD